MIRGMGRAAGAAMAAACAASLASAAHAQGVYRCTDADGGVLYADAPCRGGVRLDLAPGRANPAAIAKLQRDLEREAQQQANRDAQERELRREAAWLQAPVVVAPGAESDAYAGAPWWNWGGGSVYLPPTPPQGTKPMPPSRPVAPAASVVPARPANPAQVGR
jgi:hypothetical protein